jgi:hypothetical protein
VCSICNKTLIDGNSSFKGRKPGHSKNIALVFLKSFKYVERSD